MRLNSKFVVLSGAVLVMVGLGTGCARQQRVEPARRDGISSSGARTVSARNIKSVGISSPQWKIANPSITMEGDVLVVNGHISPAPASTMPTTKPTVQKAPRPLYLGFSIIAPDGRLIDQLLLSPTPSGDYSLRYGPAEPLPAGTTVYVAQLDDDYRMIGIGSASGPAGSGGPGMVGYNAPGGALYNYSNTMQQSLSAQSYYNQTAGRSGLGSLSPGFSGGGSSSRR